MSKPEFQEVLVSNDAVRRWSKEALTTISRLQKEKELAELK
jgi:hypothetical protein